MAVFRTTRAAVLILLLYKICSSQAALNPQLLVLSVELGKAAHLHCSLGDQSSAEVRMWYKQRLEHSPLEVASKLQGNYKDAVLSPQFNQSRFKVQKDTTGFSLTIENVVKEDEGMYFCGTGEGKTLKFSNSIFLTVTEHSNISVLQSPALQSVPPGEAVNLQCTVLSEIRSEDLRVFWIRSAAGSSFPEIIFTHHNSSSSSSSSSRQCEISSSKHSSVYNFSPNIPNNHHAATYYCAVETCGRIIIGNGTTVCLSKFFFYGAIYIQPNL
ncbi:hypothetical protein AMEX_G13267 [Astyanax mexicanus]|uniref:Ig-like domain-containing protein n=1 Tax=Astyanax mexicanus TaxID=7994 RepID=A0A8T2LR14_ASTMX|nr:hypothetical protein AMEX_G13267 [Astyanax mexicanus]